MSLRSVLRAATSYRALGFLAGAGLVGYMVMDPPSKHEFKGPEKLTSEQQQKFIPLMPGQLAEAEAALVANRVPQHMANLAAEKYNEMALRSTTEPKRLTVLDPQKHIAVSACLNPQMPSSPEFVNLNFLQIQTTDGNTKTFTETNQRSGLLKWSPSGKHDPCSKVAPHNDVTYTFEADGSYKTEYGKNKPAAASSTASKPVASQPSNSQEAYAPSQEALAVLNAQKAGGPPPNSFANTAPELIARIAAQGLAPENAQAFVNTRPDRNGIVIQEMTQPETATTAFARVNDGIFEAVCIQKNAQISEIFKPVGTPVGGKILWHASSGPEQLERINYNYAQSCADWLTIDKGMKTARVKIAPVPKPR